MSALFAIGTLIVSIIAEKFFYSQIISDIYQTVPSMRQNNKKTNYLGTVAKIKPEVNEILDTESARPIAKDNYVKEE